jgi:tetratricopeptide (TPR) repeat protein
VFPFSLSARPRLKPRHQLLPWLLVGLLLGFCLQKGHAATPETLEQIFRQGSAAYSSGNYAEAAKNYAKLLEVAPPSPALASIQFALGEALLLSGDAPEAFQAFSAYIRLYPDGEQVADARLLGTRALLAADRLNDAHAALAGIKGLRGGRNQVDNYGLVLSITLQVADQLAARGDHAKAIPLLQQTPSRAQLLALQTRRVAQLTQMLTVETTPEALRAEQERRSRRELDEQLARPAPQPAHTKPSRDPTRPWLATGAPPP